MRIQENAAIQQPQLAGNDLMAKTDPSDGDRSIAKYKVNRSQN
jgi:hypothetical protein